MSNVCEHGSLKRKCEICELHELESRYDSLLSDFLLMQKRAQTAEAKVARLRDFVSELADEDCQYGDNCTDDAMRMSRHYQCLNCKAREALKEAQRDA